MNFWSWIKECDRQMPGFWCWVLCVIVWLYCIIRMAMYIPTN